MDSVIIEKFRSCWLDSYQSESEYLASVFEFCSPRIEHIGSTSLEIDAKPIVDIAIGLVKLESVLKVDFKLLAKRRWFRIQRTFADEVVLAKYTDDCYKTKSHFAHIVVEGSKRWQEMVIFRDKLIESESLKHEYLNLKRCLASEYQDDVDGYTEAKKKFVLTVVNG
ncbi:GrpB family protein [Reinekea forsetii]|nr:GrpB family protein [Reinekea forsetii]